MLHGTHLTRTKKLAFLNLQPCVQDGVFWPGFWNSFCVQISLKSQTDDWSMSEVYHHNDRCMMGQCKECPGQNGLVDFLNQCDELIDVEEETYKQWASTDRTQLVTITESKEDFIENLSTQVFNFHDTNGRNHSSGRLCRKLLLRSSG